jgi:hypothetical protein
MPLRHLCQPLVIASIAFVAGCGTTTKSSHKSNKFDPYDGCKYRDFRHGKYADETDFRCGDEMITYVEPRGTR